MALSRKDLKILWGRSAGHCNFPGCGESCTKFLDENFIVIGEMAHVIAKRPGGPRGQAIGGGDGYENRILLCPTHHTQVDKASDGIYTSNDLRSWKQKHESNVRDAMSSPRFESMNDVARYMKKLLIENRTVWATYGPESLEANNNPFSNVFRLWVLRKLTTIVPNNRRIVMAIRKHKDLFSAESYAIACLFIEHAEGFERNCFNRSEGIPRFPEQFNKLVCDHA